MVLKELTYEASDKLSARGAAALVQCASEYEAQISIELQNKKINAKSIMGVLSLAIQRGDVFCISAAGKDEFAALNALEKLIVDSAE